MAARVIQTDFRALLVRRSTTLRQLKELALIKSSFNSLKLSVSKKPHFDFHVVSQKAKDMLLELDSMQGGDPMIRDGKRSIGKDVIKFLEFVNGFAVQKAELMSKLRDRIEKSNGFSRVIKSYEDEDVNLEGFHELLDEEEEEVNPGASRNKNGVVVKRHVVSQPRVKKIVTFVENGNVYRLIGNGKSKGSISSEGGTLTDEIVSRDDNGQGVKVEEIKCLSKDTEDDEEVYSENGGSLQSSEEERNLRESTRTEGGTYEIDEDYKVEDGQFVFSAPVPVKMESRCDLMKKRKALKIIYINRV